MNEPLEQSIAVWIKKLDIQHPRDLILGADSCPLCQVYCTTPPHDTCDGCPVKQRTGRTRCMGSPYHRVADAKDLTVQGFMPLTELKTYIQEEIDFLKSLREEPS